MSKGNEGLDPQSGPNAVLGEPAGKSKGAANLPRSGSKSPKSARVIASNSNTHREALKRLVDR